MGRIANRISRQRARRELVKAIAATACMAAAVGALFAVQIMRINAGLAPLGF